MLLTYPSGDQRKCNGHHKISSIHIHPCKNNDYFDEFHKTLTNRQLWRLITGYFVMSTYFIQCYSHRLSHGVWTERVEISLDKSILSVNLYYVPYSSSEYKSNHKHQFNFPLIYPNSVSRRWIDHLLWHSQRCTPISVMNELSQYSTFTLYTSHELHVILPTVVFDSTVTLNIFITTSKTKRKNPSISWLVSGRQLSWKTLRTFKSVKTKMSWMSKYLSSSVHIPSDLTSTCHSHLFFWDWYCTLLFYVTILQK